MKWGEMGVEQRGISWYGGVTSGKAEYFARITGIAPTTGLSICRTETSAEAICTYLLPLLFLHLPLCIYMCMYVCMCLFLSLSFVYNIYTRIYMGLVQHKKIYLKKKKNNGSQIFKRVSFFSTF